VEQPGRRGLAARQTNRVWQWRAVLQRVLQWQCVGGRLPVQRLAEDWRMPRDSARYRLAQRRQRAHQERDQAGVGGQ